MGLSSTLTLKFNGSAVQKGLAKLKNALKDFGPMAAKSLGVVAGGAAIAAGALLATAVKLNSIGEEASASNERLVSITKQMGLFGDQADEVSDRLLNLADTQARLLGVDDDVIAATQSKLMTFKEIAKSADEAGDAFDRATMAALDMAAAGFGTAESNAVQLGKALNDPVKGINALTRAGITFNAEEKKRIATLVQSNKAGEAQSLILSAIEKQVGGTAKATAKASDKINVTLAQAVEAFAIPFSKAFAKIPGMLENVFPKLSEVATRAGTLVGDAISEALSGDYSKFAAIGEFVGTAVAGGMKIGLSKIHLDATESLWKFIEDNNPVRNVWDGGKVSDYIKQGKEQTSSGQMQELMGQLREKLSKLTTTGRVPDTVGGTYRYAAPGEVSVFSDGQGNKVIQILESIDTNLKPKL